MDNLIGKTLGQYQIIGLAGRGGMATVYKAYQPSLNRYVALKVLPEFMAQDEQFVGRFRQEALAAAGLRHPNILVIHDVGQQGNTHYIAMEYLEGQTLAQVIQRTGGLDVQRTMRILDQIASALDFAHQRGLIHRDIKPANIFIGPDDHVTLMDFGIVKALASAGMTRTGTMVGTPEYMSPEQIEGRPVDRRSDLYSLGVVLYQMLTGYVPFTGDTPHAVMFAQVNKPPTPPSRLTAFVTPEVEAVVMRALAKNPAERFSSAREMASALSQAVAGRRPVPGEQTLVSPRTLPAVPPPPARKSTGTPWLILAGVGALGLIVVIVVALIAAGAFNIKGGLPMSANALSSATPTPAATSTLMPTVTSIPSTPTTAPSPLPISTPTSAPTATRAQLTDTPSPVPTASATPTRAATQAVVPAATARPGVLFDFETMPNWRRGDQPNGTLTQSTQQAHSGQASARLDYDYPGGGNDFVVFLNEVPLGGQPNAVSAWVYGDGSGHFCNAWIKDSGGQVWQVPLGRVGSASWKQMAGTIATGQAWPWAHISGPDNGRVDYPISFYALVLDDKSDTYAGRGTVYIDDIAVGQTAIAATPAATPVAQATTPGSAPTVANEPRGVTLYSPINGSFFKSSAITFKWSGGALQSGETFLVEIIPAQAEKKGECTLEQDYGSGGHQFSPPLTDHQWTIDIAAVPVGKYKPCAGRIEWRVHVKDAAGNVIQSTPRNYFEWNPL
jgi:serine/threonine-protein kinase